MRRIPIALLAAACALLVAGGTATAKFKPRTCTTHSKNVIDHKVKGTLTARNVDPGLADLATCAQAKIVMNRITSLRIEKPKRVDGFYCLPTVLSTEPDVVKYRCTLKGADTPMIVKLAFRVKYNLD